MVKHSILPPRSVTEVLRPLMEFEDSKFLELKAEIGGPFGLVFEKKRGDIIADKLELSIAHVEALFSVLNGLHSRVNDILSDASKISEAISEFVDRIFEDENESNNTSLNEHNSSVLKSRIVDLLTGNFVAIEKSKKVARLRDGFLKNLTGVDSFVDLRPNFDEKSTNIEHWIGMVQFRIRTDSSIALEREFIFQCDIEKLRELKLACERAEEKLNSMLQVAQSKGFGVDNMIGNN